MHGRVIGRVEARIHGGHRGASLDLRRALMQLHVFLLELLLPLIELHPFPFQLKLLLLHKHLLLLLVRGMLLIKSLLLGYDGVSFHIRFALHGFQPLLLLELIV